MASLLCSYLIARFGSDWVKFYGTVLFFLGTSSLVLVNIYYPTSPLFISLAMATLAAGTAIAVVVYFSNSMFGITNAGAAVSFAQVIRLFFSYELITSNHIIFRFILYSTAGSGR